jgi:hypothetical protein
VGVGKGDSRSLRYRGFLASFSKRAVCSCGSIKVKAVATTATENHWPEE